MAVAGVEGFPVSLTTVLALFVLLPAAYYGFLVTRFLREKGKIAEKVALLPGPERHWLFGNLRQHPGVGEKGLAWMVDLANKHKKVYRLFFGNIGCSAIVVHPDTVKPILRSSEPKPNNGLYRILEGWLGDGLLLSSGSKWFRNRRLLTPAFHFDVLKPYMKIYNEATDIFMDQLETASKTGSVEICRPVTLMTLNIILRCAFSSELDVQRQGKTPYATAVLGMASLIIKRIFNPLVYNRFVYNLTRNGKLMHKYMDTVHAVSDDVIAKRKIALRENPEAASKRYKDFLDILLLARDEDGTGLTDREIRDEVDTFLFEGHDTTASAISWLLYEMARHPDHQQTCREEVEQFLGNRETKHMEWEDLQHLQFTTQCIREAMRLHSPVPWIARELTQETEVEGVTLKAGTEISIAIYLCNHNEHVWGPDHMEFKPERFDEERVEVMDSFAFVPFSAGPRNCIGQNFAMHEIKVVLARMLNRFELTLDQSHEVKHVLEVVMRAETGIKVFLKPRQ